MEQHGQDRERQRKEAETGPSPGRGVGIGVDVRVVDKVTQRNASSRQGCTFVTALGVTDFDG
jgi:hypothetical protein